MNRLSGKVALITGATGALGSAVTQGFLDAGAQVAGVSRRIQDTDFDGAGFAALPAELTSLEAARDVTRRARERFGRIDIAVHLVGGYESGPRVEATGDDAFARQMDLNFHTALHLFRAVLPEMRAQGAGRLLAIGSRAAMEPVAQAAPYVVSKAALLTLVRVIAAETAGEGITANAIVPGTLDTPANRKAQPDADYSRWVPPAELARLLAHLASDAAAHINGALIPVYGYDA